MPDSDPVALEADAPWAEAVGAAYFVTAPGPPMILFIKPAKPPPPPDPGFAPGLVGAAFCLYSFAFLSKAVLILSVNLCVLPYASYFFLSVTLLTKFCILLTGFIDSVALMQKLAILLWNSVSISVFASNCDRFSKVAKFSLS